MTYGAPYRVILTGPRLARTALATFYDARNYPEPPRNSGEADAVHGPTALGTHHDNTLEGKHTGPGARP